MRLQIIVFVFTCHLTWLNAATFTVDSTTDAPDATPGDGVCATAAGACTLRAAIQEANATAGPDTINLPDGNYLLTLAGAGEDAAATGDLDVLESLTINGASQDNTIVDGNGIDRVFEIFSPADFVVSELTIRNGDVVGFGGGINNSSAGDMDISNTTIQSNSATGFGGGVSYSGSGSVTITDSNILENTAGGFGGGINNNSRGSLSITNSSITDNMADSFGGGINNNFNGSATVIDTTISENTAENGGGINNNHTGTFEVTRSTIAGNSASDSIGGGGILNNSSGPMTITNSTISGNSSQVVGGGLTNNSNGTVTTLNSTFFNNSAADGGGIFINSSGPVSLENTIVAGSPSGGDCGGNPPTSLGNNLDSDGTCGLSAAGDLSSTNPLLAPLQDYGGPTLTHALTPGSPAIDAANDASCPPTDQRGVLRPQDGDSDGTATCDMGSFELQLSAVEEVMIPTLSEWGLILLFTLLLGFSLIELRKRQLGAG